MTPRSRRPGAWLRRALVAGLLMLLAAGCGFKLRGSYGISEVMQPLYLQASGDFGRVLESNLATGGVELADSPANAASVLEVRSAQDDRRTLAIDEEGRVDEYEVVFRVTWRLAAGEARSDDEPLIGETEYGAGRSFVFDPESRLAADDEEEVLIEELHADLADRILRRLAAWSPGDAPEDD